MMELGHDHGKYAGLMGRSNSGTAASRLANSARSSEISPGGLFRTAEARRSLTSATLATPSGTPRQPPPPPPPATPAVAPADVTIVRSAAELQAALRSRAQDIEIREHLDLDSVPAVGIPEGRQGMFDHSSSAERMIFAAVEDPTRSIRVCPLSWPPHRPVLARTSSPRSCALRGAATASSRRQPWQSITVLQNVHEALTFPAMAGKSALFWSFTSPTRGVHNCPQHSTKA